MNELVSIIVPIYNIEDYLEKCVNTLVNQTYNNLEILLIDDGSTDSSGQLADKLGATDERIKVIHRKNGGLSAARNTGLDNCSGDYICFVDSDDYVRESYVEDLLNACVTNDAMLSLCMFFSVRNDEEIANSFNGKDEVITPKQACLRTWDNPYIVSWNKLYRKDIFEDIRFPEGRLHEDIATTYKCFWKANRIAVVHKELYGYRVNDNGIMRSKYNSKRYDEITAVKEAIAFFDKKDNEICKQFYLMFFIRTVSHLRRTAMHKELKKKYFRKLQLEAMDMLNAYKKRYGSSLKVSRLAFGIHHPALYHNIMKLRRIKRHFSK